MVKDELFSKEREHYYYLIKSEMKFFNKSNYYSFLVIISLF
jgi:hypothetical protein